MKLSISVGVEGAGYKTTRINMKTGSTEEMTVGRVIIRMCALNQETTLFVYYTDIEDENGKVMRDENGQPLEVAAGSLADCHAILEEGDQRCIYPGKIVEHPDGKFDVKVDMKSALGGGGDDGTG